MKKTLLPVLVITLCQLLANTSLATETSLTILSYHEIAEPEAALTPAYAVSPTAFVRQLDWLKNHGYHFVSVDAILADRAGRQPLPAKPVLLTFDDGYRSVFTHAFPALKLFHAPAVVSLVGSWLEEKGAVSFDGKQVPRDKLMSWDDINALQQSGLVEIASHSYALHQGIIGNPQGNQQPAATTRAYDSKTHTYENDATYRKRIEDDIKRNITLIRAHTGHAPRIMTWPYGRYNAHSATLAQKHGLTIGLTLDDGANTRTEPLSQLRRTLVDSSMSWWDIEREIRLRDADISDNDRPTKAVHVDLDYLYDADAAQQERNIGALLDRLERLGANTVYLQAFSDPDGDGAADAVYFPCRHLPLRSDLFNRVAWQIRTRTPIRRVYAWMPMLAFHLPDSEPAHNDLVVALQKSDSTHLNMGYTRLSPFSPRVQQTVREIYQDLGRSAAFDGLLFHDDVTLSDYEDNSPWAQQTWREWGLPAEVAAIRANDDLLGRWTILKINALDNFAGELAAIVRQDIPWLRTARNLYARVALNPKAEVWYSQSLDNSLQHYDFTAIMAMPYMENSNDPQAFYHELIDKVKDKPDGLRKTLFELQAMDWRNQQPIPARELADTISALYRLGVQHVGYYPDDPFQNHPDNRVLKPVLDSKSNAPILPGQ